MNLFPTACMLQKGLFQRSWETTKTFSVCSVLFHEQKYVDLFPTMPASLHRILMFSAMCPFYVSIIRLLSDRYVTLGIHGPMWLNLLYENVKAFRDERFREQSCVPKFLC